MNFLKNKKKYYFLSGLPRSGNTVLSSILNQNPEVQVSAQSPVCDIMTSIESHKQDTTFINFPDEQSIDDCVFGLFGSYYKSWKARYIIDRGIWGLNPCLDRLERNFDDLKIICPVRDLNEILASYIVNYHRKDVVDIRYPQDVTRMVRDEIMVHGGLMYKSLWNVKNLSLPHFKDKVYFMNYDNLCKNPERELNNIYDFLGIKKCKHDFNNISTFEVNGERYLEHLTSSPMGNYYVKPKVEKSKRDINEVLSNEVRDQYRDYTVDTYKEWLFPFS